MTAKTGYSRPAERLGARIARKLNTPNPGAEDVAVEPWLLHQDLIAILTERYYQLTLVGLEELGLAKPKDEYRTGYNDDQFAEAERGAELWLDKVLDAPRQVHPRKPTHEAHNILLALAERGVDWPATALGRGETSAQPTLMPRWLRRTAEALARAAGREDIAQMHPRGGVALQLTAGAVALEVPEGLPIWQAMASAPERCRPLDGRAADEQVYLFVRAVHGANKHWDALRRLGLAPPDWMAQESWEADEKLATLSTSQALDALKFIACAEAFAAAAGREDPSPEDYRAAWAEKAILKRLTFEDFAATPAGRALMRGRGAGGEDIAADLPGPDDDGPDTLAEHSDLESMIDRLESSGMFQAAEIRLLRAIAGGEPLSVIHQNDGELRLRYPRLEDLKAGLEPLQDRVLAAVTGEMGT